MTEVHVADMLHLIVGDLQELCKLFTVGRALIQHYDKFTVCQHGSCRVALEQIVHVLRNTGAKPVVLSDSLPQGKQEIRAELMLEQQIDFVDKDIRFFRVYLKEWKN